MKKALSLLFSCILVITLLPGPAGAAGFKDVPRDHWAHDEIRFLSGKQVIKGYAGGTFQPLKTLTRKDAAIMVVRALKWPKPANPLVKPADMKPTMGGYNEIIAAVNKGLFTLSGNKFNPNGALSREEMARVIAVAYSYKGKGVSSFKDVAKSNSYYKYIDAIAENEITSGYKDGTFKPKVNVNRAQFSTFLARIYGQPLEYAVKQNGKIIASYREEETAIQKAVQTANATVHPVSNSLMTYAQQPQPMTKSGIKNGVIIYNGAENENGSLFSKDFFKPYLAYKQGNNSYTGKMFDSFLVIGRKYSSNGEFAEASGNKANYKEFMWYADRTFAKGGALDVLNQDAKALGKKPNVYISIPYPKRGEAIVLSNGKSVKNTLAERQKLVNAYRQQVEAKWKSSGYTNLTFKGYYWLNETVISLEDEQLVEQTATAIHKTGKTFIYSPHATSTNFENWQTYGFDAAYLQPNAFRLTLNDTEARLHKAFLRAQVNGSGINIEIDSYSPHQMGSGAVNFRDYLEMAARYRLPGQSLIMYQGTEMVSRMATYNDQTYNSLYKELYEMIN
ncbi:DUF4855 domain-containing protein [Domibacillus iocasae]|uniref:SLH domain-containing protein n=1 Tax=Domibacillus iocasae TaxID=1714016 RepID=A0A1E7DQL1_9BACI|nr:DUF4855 domain-containing protein [Domibacillus iocasae]OES44968.1 hypothetical protein BA724_06810 [Domibacillus iocasae]